MGRSSNSSSGRSSKSSRGGSSRNRPSSIHGVLVTASSYASNEMTRPNDSSQTEIARLIESLQTHRVNTLTELCRIERIAATCENEDDAISFQGPMTEAWLYYVTSHQLLTELRGLTRSFPFSGEVLSDAQHQVRNDPQSDRSWNYAWLVLMKVKEMNLIPSYAQYEATMPDMWGDREPSEDEINQLAECFRKEWTDSVDTMLRHWTVAPTWF